MTLCLFAPQTTEAKSSGKTPGLVRHALVVGELVVPDVRLEFHGASPAQIVLAWPIVWSAMRLEFGKNDPCPSRLSRRWKTLWDENACEVEWGICLDCSEPRAGYLTLLPFLEGQWVWDVRDVRALAGMRTIVGASKSSFGLAIEGGALIGTDGYGGFAGAGISRRVERSGLNIGLMGRRVWVTGVNRWDLTIDLQVPINWPSL